MNITNINPLSSTDPITTTILPTCAPIHYAFASVELTALVPAKTSRNSKQDCTYMYRGKNVNNNAHFALNLHKVLDILIWQE